MRRLNNKIEKKCVHKIYGSLVLGFLKCSKLDPNRGLIECNFVDEDVVAYYLLDTGSTCVEHRRVIRDVPRFMSMRQFDNRLPLQ